MFDFLSQKYSGLILLVILLAISIAYNLYSKKHPKSIDESKEDKFASPLDLNDEDATVASLVAAIECRNETHKNVHIISVREIK